MNDERPDCKVINLAEWVKAKQEKEKRELEQRLLKQVLERGNPSDKK